VLRGQVARAGEAAAAIYTADKLTNLEEMRRIYASLGEGAIDLHKAPTLDLRVAAWERDLDMVRRVAPRLALVEQLREELDAFASERRTARSTSPC
jgi:hypothetical protein